MKRLCFTLALAAALCACSFKTNDFVVADGSTHDDTNVDDTGSDDTNQDDTTIDETTDTNIDDTNVDETDATVDSPADSGLDTLDTAPDTSGFDAAICTEAGGIACGSPATCTLPQDDPLHCSSAASCGVACDPSQFCENGACTCRPGLTACGGACVDVSGDENHCGGCPGTLCAGADKCSSGACTTTACPAGRTKCNRSCWDLAGDPTHCGSSCLAFVACAADQLCIGGSCVQYRPAFGCTSTSGCDCTKVLVGARPCPALTGSTDGVPICVAGSFCPAAPWN